jgi:hypothetical protein
MWMCEEESTILFITRIFFPSDVCVGGGPYFEIINPTLPQ